MTKRSANHLPDECVGDTVGGRYRLTGRVGGPREYLFRAQCVVEKERPRGNPFLSDSSVDGHRDMLLVELTWPATPAERSQLVDAARRRIGASHALTAKYCEVGTNDSGKLAGAMFLVTEAATESLAEIVASRGSLEEDQLISLTRSIGEALDCLHSRGDLLGPVESSDVLYGAAGWKLRPSLSGLDKCLSSFGGKWQTSDDIRAVGLLLLQFAAESEKLEPIIRRCVAKNRQDRPSAAEIALACTKAPPVTEATLSRNASGFEIHWQPPERGQVRVLRPARRREFRVGAVLLTSQLAEVGDLLIPNCDRSIQINGVGEVVILTIDGPAATVGGQIRLSGILDVSGLSANYAGGKLNLTWRWPREIVEAVVSCRADRFPVHPHETDTVSRRVSRVRYSSEGVRLAISDWEDRIYVAVFSAETTRQGTNYSSAATPGARLCVPLRLCRVVEYEIVRNRPSSGSNGDELRLKLLAETKMELPELLLVAKRNGIPTSPEDGTCVLRIQKGAFCSATEAATVGFSFPQDYRDIFWNARLFPADAELGRWLTLAPRRKHKGWTNGRQMSGTEWLLVCSLLAVAVGIILLIASTLLGADFERNAVPSQRLWRNESESVTGPHRSHWKISRIADDILITDGGSIVASNPSTEIDR